MCLAVPMKVKKLLPDGHAQVELGGVLHSVNVKMVSGVNIGEYVLVHAGFAIEKINAKEAQETLRIMDEIR